MSPRKLWVQRPSWIKIFPQLVNKKSQFKEPKFSLSYSQTPIPGPMSRFHNLHIYLFITHFNIIPSVTAKCSELFLSFRFAHRNPVCISLLSHSRHIPSPPHHFWLDHSNNIWRAVQIVMLIIHISPASCYILPKFMICNSEIPVRMSTIPKQVIV